MNYPTSNIGPYQRCDWNAGEAGIVRVAARLDQIKGSASGLDDEAARTLRYSQAKTAWDHDAAAALVDDWVSEQYLDEVISDLERYLEEGRRIIFIHPKPRSDADPNSPTPTAEQNALPFALAAVLEDTVGGELNDCIFQGHRVGRSGMNRFQRLVHQPKFVGEVDPQAVYVLVDDVYTLGGTLAMLRSHIVMNGGTVGCVCVLGHSKGVHQRFPLARDTQSVLNSVYGGGLDALWLEEIGHGILQITDAEGRHLCHTASGFPRDASQSCLERLRAQVHAERTSGR